METTELTAQFKTTAYSMTLSGTAEIFGWTPDASTKALLASMEPAKARRAALRCKRAASEAYDAAHNARCAR